jgi:hypothetical protein
MAVASGQGLLLRVLSVVTIRFVTAAILLALTTSAAAR